jgi:hypothetical protein
MRRLLFVLILLPLLLSAKAPHREKWQLSVGADIGYDNNVFSLSDSDLDKFDAGDPSFEFMESSDDVVLSPSASLSRTWKWRKINLTPTLKGDYKLYTANSDKSAASVLASLKCEYRRWNATLTVATYPDNYVRNYVDKDGTGASEKYDYDKNLYKFSCGTRFWKHDYPSMQVKYEVYRYNRYFTEYDGEATTVGFDWKHSFPTFYFTAGYDYRVYNCKDLNTVESSAQDVGDGSYESNIYSFSLQNKKVKIGRGKYLRPGLSFGYEDRYYQTDKPDKFHANRNDRKYTLTGECSFDIMRHTMWTLEYTKVHRNAESDYYPRIGDTKDYYADQVWLRMQYDLSL